MTKTFRNLVLIPSLFLLAIVSSIGFQYGSWTPFIIIFLAFEHLYDWNKNIERDKISDFRVFFLDQFTRYIYILVTLLFGLIIPFVWEYLSYWSLFGFALNFIIFRLISNTAVKKVSDAAPAGSKVVSLDNSIWKENKMLLINFINENPDLINKNDVEDVIDSINYSSFLRSERASEMINNVLNSSSDKLKINLNKLINLL